MCLIQHGKQLDVTLITSSTKAFLYIGVEVTVPSHVGHPALLQKTGKHLTNAEGQSDEMEMFGLTGVIFGLLFAQEMENTHLQGCWYSLHCPTRVEQVK